MSVRKRKDSAVSRQGPVDASCAKRELLAADEARDRAVCGRSLACDAATALAAAGAHDPTATPYFVLEELLSDIGLGSESHLLDVGCALGRVLAYCVDVGCPAQVTGLELDAGLAREAASWASAYLNLEVRCGSVLDEPLAPYTHFYLFNPFDTAVLTRFLDRLEHEARQAVTVVHMSDNGERLAYLPRGGWRALRQGSIQDHRLPSGSVARVYGHPQTYTVWRYEPIGTGGVPRC